MSNVYNEDDLYDETPSIPAPVNLYNNDGLYIERMSDYVTFNTYNLGETLGSSLNSADLVQIVTKSTNRLIKRVVVRPAISASAGARIWLFTSSEPGTPLVDPVGGYYFNNGFYLGRSADAVVNEVVFETSAPIWAVAATAAITGFPSMITVAVEGYYAD